jgi:drug/metabolite transporter (DMT)-like permease
MLTKTVQKGISLAVITAIISGISIFLNKFAVTDTDPAVLVFMKNSIAALIIIFLILLKNKQETKTLKSLKFKPNHFMILVLIGLIGGSIPFLLFFKGLSLTSASQAAFIHKNMFLATFFLAPVLIKEKISKRFINSAVLILLGNFFILNQLNLFQLNQGTVYIAIATILWALEAIFLKKVLKKLPAKLVAGARMGFGSLFILMFLILSKNLPSLSQITVQNIFWILATSVLLTGYVLSWYQALKYLKASTATAVLTLGTVITSFLNLILSRTIKTQEILGISFLLTGIFILSQAKKLRLPDLPSQWTA